MSKVHPNHWLTPFVNRITPRLRSTAITAASSLLRVAPPLTLCIGILPRGGRPLVISLHIKDQVPTFRIEACTGLMPPLHRLPPEQLTGILQTCPGERDRPQF
jgi:hypothetical protein